MLEILLGSRLRARLLGWLFTHPDERFFGRQLAVILGEDSTNVSRELLRLTSLGILTSKLEGKQKYYQANRLCPVFSELHSLAVKTIGINDLLREALEPFKDKIRTAFIYGSFAELKEQMSSDLDLVIVGDVTIKEINVALTSVQEHIQREINPSVYSIAEFTEKSKSGQHFINSVLTKPKIFIVGDEHDLENLAG